MSTLPHHSIIPDPATMLYFSPHVSGAIFVQSDWYDSVQICNANPGIQAYSAPGSRPSITMLPSEFMQVYQTQADRFRGFVVLHGPSSWAHVPMLLYSIYPMEYGDYFGYRPGQIICMQWHLEMPPYVEGGWPIGYPKVGTSSTVAYPMPPHYLYRCPLFPSAQSQFVALGGHYTRQVLPHAYSKADPVRTRDFMPAQSGVLSGNGGSSKSRPSQSTPPPEMSVDRDRLVEVESRLDALEVRKCIDDIHDASSQGYSTPRRARCSTGESVNPRANGTGSDRSAERVSRASFGSSTRIE